jgi:hypothetical protein
MDSAATPIMVGDRGDRRIARALGYIPDLQGKAAEVSNAGWPTTPGAVGSLQIRKVDGGMNGVDYWKVAFDYTYHVHTEHSGKYSFNCVTEKMAEGAVTGLRDKAVSVHYKPSDESKGIVWEDEVWDLWWDTYWQAGKSANAATSQ